MSDRDPRLDLRRGLPFLARRGPDSQRAWTSADGRVSLLHARLSIVDFDERANQPMSDASGQVTVVFVGEIYNYRELRQGMPDYPYWTESDTEVTLAQYLTHGVEGFRRLRGMFVVAIADQRRRRVVLVRDPVGKKPLFFGNVGAATMFGCSLIAMLAAAGQAAEINAEAMGDYAREGCVHPSRCLMRGFRPVLPGEVVELDWEGREVARSDCRPACRQEAITEGGEAIRAEVGRLLRRAVERRLEHNPAPTTLLSGGIDSTVVTAEAHAVCRERGLPLQVLTLGSVVPWRNDEPYARYAARRMRIGLEILRIPKRHLAERVMAALDVQDEPLGMVAYFTLFELVRAAKHYGRILITGDGGDEVFLGYGKPSHWLRSDGEIEPGDGEFPCGPPLPDWIGMKGRRMVTSQLVGHMFTKADRASAEQGVEIRCPLLDWDLACYARRLPPGVLLAGDRMKAQLKHHLAGWPGWFLERPKVGLAFNIRYLWGLSNYAGFRESVVPEAREAMGDAVPVPLRRRANLWGAADIFRNFDAAWRLLALSRFFERMRWIS